MAKREKRPTQCERILKYIRDFGSISTWQAMMDLGVARLASRIFDLKQQGYVFQKRRVTTKKSVRREYLLLRVQISRY